MALKDELAQMMVENLRKAQENPDERDAREEQRKNEFHPIELPEKKTA